VRAFRVLVAGGKPVTGHDSIRDAFNVFLSSGARMKLDTRAVIETGEGLAVLTTTAFVWIARRILLTLVSISSREHSGNGH
jgi:hypothetical protein